MPDLPAILDVIELVRLTEPRDRQGDGVCRTGDITEHEVGRSISGGLIRDAICPPGVLVPRFVEIGAANLGAELDGVFAVGPGNTVHHLEDVIRGRVRTVRVVAKTAIAISQADVGNAPGRGRRVAQQARKIQLFDDVCYACQLGGIVIVEVQKAETEFVEKGRRQKERVIDRHLLGIGDQAHAVLI